MVINLTLLWARLRIFHFQIFTVVFFSSRSTDFYFYRCIITRMRNLLDEMGMRNIRIMFIPQKCYVNFWHKTPNCAHKYNKLMVFCLVGDLFCSHFLRSIFLWISYRKSERKKIWNGKGHHLFICCGDVNRNGCLYHKKWDNFVQMRHRRTQINRE